MELRFIEFFKRKIEYDINRFLYLVEKEADKLNIDYLSVDVEITRYKKNDYDIRFKCYLDGHDFYEGKTINKALSELRKSLNKKPNRPLNKAPKIKVKLPLKPK